MADISEEAVNEVARNLFDGGDIDYTIERDGSANIDTWNLPDVDSYEYSYGTVNKETLDKAIELLTKLISSVKFYVGDNGASLELNDNHTLWDINAPDEYKGEFDYDYYQYLVEQALDDFKERTGVEAHQDGRMGRHIVVDITFDNMIRFDELKAIQEELEADVIEKAEAECFSVVDGMTESLNKGEKKARCLSCGADVIYTNRDVCHDIDGDYIECPNCNATFDVDYDAITPLLNKKIESYEVWQRYFEDGEIARPEYVQSFDIFEKAQKFADGLNEDPNCEAWVKDLNKSKKVTEAEDMTQVKDDVKSAVEKSDSTKQEKDQVKGSIDVLKTDEESAIDGYEEFNKETAKVVDKELSDEIDNQMQEIVDDEKEHIEKLDTIKSALGESKSDYEDLGFEDNYIICKDCYDKEKGRDDYTKYKVDINNIPICANCGKESMDIDYYKLKSTLGESLELDDEETKFINDMVVKTKEDIEDFLGYDLTDEQFDDKQSLRLAIKEIYEQMPDEEFNKFKSALGESKKEEDCTQANAIQGPTTVFGSKDNKLEEEVDNATIKERLNTGVLRIIDVDMYSINDEIPESATQEGLDEIVQDIAPKYIKEVIQEVLPSVEIYATGVYHPKQYNFSGDELEFDLVANKEEYEALKEKVTSNENFNAFLRNNYKSYDGFISYMADDISEFETQDIWKQVVQVIMFAIQDEDNFEAIRNEYLDEFLDRVHTEFGWNDEDDLEESKEIDVSPIEELEGLTEEVSNGKQ